MLSRSVDFNNRATNVRINSVQPTLISNLHRHIEVFCLINCSQVGVGSTAFFFVMLLNSHEAL